MSFEYKYSAIQKTIASLPTQVATLSNITEYTYTPTDITALTATTETNQLSVNNVVNRIKLYEDIISSQINSDQLITDAFGILPDNVVSCASRPTQIQYQDGLVELTGYPKRDENKIWWTTLRYDFIVNLFVSQAAKTVTKPYSKQFYTYNVDAQKLLASFNNFTGFDSVFETIDTDTRQHELMRITPILTQLNQFIQQIQSIRMLQTSFSVYKTSISSIVEMRAKDYDDQELANEDAGLARFYTKAYCGPYTIYRNNNTNKYQFNYIKPEIYKNDKVELSTLVKIDREITNMSQEFYKKEDYTNGILTFNSAVLKSNQEEFTDIQTLKDQFKLSVGNIISQKNLLKAVDYIFYRWLQQIGTVLFQSDICHSNCHSNSCLIFNYLKTTGCCACGCTVEATYGYITEDTRVIHDGKY